MKKRIRRETTNLRFNILTIIVYIIGVILIVKLFELQIIKGADYRETSNTRLSRESTLEASRGEILDRSGNILATTTSAFNIELYKTKSDDDTLNNCISIESPLGRALRGRKAGEKVNVKLEDGSSFGVTIIDIEQI